MLITWFNIGAKSTHAKNRNPSPVAGVPSYLGVGALDLDALITGAQAARLAGVTRAAVCIWRDTGRLTIRARRGRSPLYRLGDVLDVERDTRQSGKANRGPRAA